MSTDHRPPLPSRLRTGHWIALDAVVVIAISAAGLAGGWRAAAGWAPAWLATTAGLGALLPLAVRRIWPLPVWMTVLLCSCGSVLISGARYPAFELAYATYLVAARRSARSTAAVLACAVAALCAAVWLAPPVESTGSPAGLMVTSTIVVALAAALGGLARAQRSYVTRMRELATGEAVAWERLRIARELHDSVAHRMSVIAVQAGVANYVVEDQPDEAGRALQAIEETSRAGLRELRSMLGLLRTRDRTLDVDGGWCPGVAGLDELISPFRAAGLPVQVVTTGAARRLPPTVDASVYRIVQEALTNVLRHASATRAEVAIAYTADSVTVRVTDDGRGPAKTMPGWSGRQAGHGILGMRERVGICGGELTIGAVPAPASGFRVSARLPLDEAAA